MNVHVSYRLPKNPAVEKDVQHQIEKLEKRLQVFRPDLVHLKGMVEEVSPREGTSVSLNLRLPSGQMAVQKAAPIAHQRGKGGLRRLAAAGEQTQGPVAGFAQVAARTAWRQYASQCAGA